MLQFLHKPIQKVCLICTWPSSHPAYFITTYDGYQSIIPLRRHHCFDAIGNNIAGIREKAHSIGAHRDPITYTDGMKMRPRGDLFCLISSFISFANPLRCILQGLPSSSGGSDTDLGFFHIVIIKSNCMKHSLSCRLRRILRYVFYCIYLIPYLSIRSNVVLI